MQRGFERDYRFLISRIIPRDLLSSGRQETLRDALAGSSKVDMIREAYLSLEELTTKGTFARSGVNRSSDNVELNYRRVGHPTRITLSMTKDEWERVSGKARSGLLPSVFAGIISSMSLNDSPKTFTKRIEEIVELIGRIYDDATGHLILLRELPLDRDRIGERLIFTSWSDLSANRFYKSCMTSGLSHTFIRLSNNYRGENLFPIRPGTRSIVLLPLLARETRWGILEIHFHADDSIDRQGLFNLHLLGEGIKRMLENNKNLERMVSVDRLTQVHNRNYYETQLPLEIERANRNRNSLAFIIMDIDDFKNVNDRYGHDVGDLVLRMIAQTVKKDLRKIDLLFRYGGEEFIALLPGAGREDAERTADRLREAVEHSSQTLDDGTVVRATISIGGCVYPDDAQNEIELFRIADKTLYLSKRDGKNKVTFYEPFE